MGCLFHKWGEWEDIKGKCQQIKKCIKCGDTKTQEKDHNFGSWEYKTSDSCIQYRTCKECNISEERENHKFNDWHYYEDDTCTKIRECKRCGKYQRKEECPDSIIIKDEEKCVETSMCPRCNDVKIKSVDHLWVESVSNYRDCLEYVIKVKTDKIEKLQIEIDYILKNANGNTLDSRYLQLSAEIDNLKHDKSINQIKLNNASEYTKGLVCKRCLFVKKIGRTNHFEELNIKDGLNEFI